MSATTTTDDAIAAVAAPDGQAEKLYRSSEVSMILGSRWQLVCGRESLAKISDSLGLQTRATPNGKRRWTLKQIEEIAAVLQVEAVMARGAVELVLEARDHPAVKRLFDALAAVSEVRGRGLSAGTTAA